MFLLYTFVESLLFYAMQVSLSSFSMVCSCFSITVTRNMCQCPFTAQVLMHWWSLAVVGCTHVHASAISRHAVAVIAGLASTLRLASLPFGLPRDSLASPAWTWLRERMRPRPPLPARGQYLLDSVYLEPRPCVDVLSLVRAILAVS